LFTFANKISPGILNIPSDGLKCRLNGRTLSLPLFGFDLSTPCDGDLPRFIGGLPIDHVHGSAQANVSGSDD
jgi:hypothetical protein